MSRKIVAILRGVRPGEVEAIAAAIIDAGISTIEVPLNSPEPFDSISRIAAAFGREALVGAGTVLAPEQAEQVHAAGGRLIVSPNCDPSVIARTLELGMVSMPGVFTATECFSAIRAGARQLKLFPGSVAGPEGLKALKAVLPGDAELHAVGGASAENFGEWIAAGADGFGIGSALYKPGMPAEAVAEKAARIVSAYDRALAAGGKADG